MLLSTLLLLHTTITLSLDCTNNTRCEDLLRIGSTCIDNKCTNPYEKGCLRRYLGKDTFPNKRICNSYDPPGSYEAGLCEKVQFDYSEIRIAGQNWDSALMTGMYIPSIPSLSHIFVSLGTPSIPLRNSRRTRIHRNIIP